MKNKQTTYILLGAVLCVWGMIFMQVGKGLFQGEPESPSPATAGTFTAAATGIPDTFSLSLTYKDPFLKGGEKQSFRSVNLAEARTTTAYQPPPVAPVAVNPAPAVDTTGLERVVYVGMITNADTKRKICIVHAYGKEHMIGEGEKLDRIQFLKAYKDSVKVQFAHKIHYIKRR